MAGVIDKPRGEQACPAQGKPAHHKGSADLLAWWRHRLGQVIHDCLAHLTQIVSGPGVLLTTHIHGGFHGEFLGVKKQGGGVLQCLINRHAGIDAEQRFLVFAVVAKCDDAEGGD